MPKRIHQHSKESFPQPPLPQHPKSSSQRSSARGSPSQRAQETSPRSSQRPTAAAPTSWDPVASWYKRWVGKEGSEYHRKLAIPAAIDLLDLNSHESLLDVGCGTGIVSHYLPKGVDYTGVDASPKLIAYARATYGADRRFVVGDARRLDRTPGIRAGEADAALFLLSIQDMGPLEQTLASVAWAVKETGRIVIVMLHPCFRVPRQSGWGWDEQRKLQYRRIDSYLSPMVVPVRPVAKGRRGAIKSFHAPLQDYVNGLSKHGFQIDRLVEIPAYPGIERRSPNAKAENRANREIPVYLGLRARRQNG